jgi:hypothetical protein
MSNYYTLLNSENISVVYETELQAVFTYATTNGIALPKSVIRYKLNLMMISMKACGFWTKIDSYFNFCYNDISLYQFSRIDWKRLVIGDSFGGYSYLNNGFVGNGTDAYFDTKFNPTLHGVNYTLTNASKGFIKNTSPNTSGTANLMGIITNTSTESVRSQIATIQSINSGGTQINTSVDLTGFGLISINRSNTDVIFYKNNVQFLRTANYTSIVNTNFFLLRGNTFYAPFCLSAVWFGALLSQTITEDYRVLYNKYLSNIGLPTIA